MTYELHSTDTFDKWLHRLKNRPTKNRVMARLGRVENGNFGDFKQVDNNLFELRFFFGSGLRVYYTIRGRQVVLLLTGGDKSTQAKDIKTATELLHDMEA